FSDRRRHYPERSHYTVNRLPAIVLRIENPPLARALHATVELDQPIPPEHYKAVAEVIGYVMRLRRAASGLRS
ncbi:MAG: EscU/YscU/HrcU family type III secretion system export apparatus switch protein, partial [Pseudolabrys sp.]